MGWKHCRNLNTWILINPCLIAVEGAKSRVGSRGSCCGAFRTFMTTGCPYTRLPMLWCFFLLPSSSKIKPGCTMNIMSLLLLVFNFQTVGGKCTDNKCSLHARSLPVLSSVSWNSGHMNLTEAFHEQNKLTVQFFLWQTVQVGQPYLAHSNWDQKESFEQNFWKSLSLSLPPSPSLLSPSLWVIHQWIWLLQWYFSEELLYCCNIKSGKILPLRIGVKTDTRKVFIRQTEVTVKRSKRFHWLEIQKNFS